MDSLLDFLRILLDVYLVCVLVWALLSWIPMLSPSLATNPVLSSVRRFLDSVIEPVLTPIRRTIPPVRMGAGLLDLSAIVLIVLIYVLQYILAAL